MDQRADVLQALVDAEDFERLFELVTIEEVAEAWCRYSGRDHPEGDDDPDWWAIELLMTSAIFENSGRYRALLLALLDHADGDVVGSIGAGPLENFVSDNEDDLRWLEAECASNSKLREALAGVWCTSFVSDATMSRLDAAARVALERPTPRDQWPAELIALDDAREQLFSVAGAEWWLLENPTEEQELAVMAYFAATDMLGRMSPDPPRDADPD